ncbi:porin family protein [Dysgonomonas macrotermitis]|uniref:Outer membrane protein beta-barrel domain-containing protein n=1 Tax=Dysgonomonas macrotermitis TaxID=1346286 RepID=A0A1M5F2X5_9BACT|nr:porin family protein [Dysgonomonas macrotermitis]SHF85698.1 Outer membrane protein beta-barrel domain-containing protein [Dysgonomonas macrotermitis]
MKAKNKLFLCATLFLSALCLNAQDSPWAIRIKAGAGLSNVYVSANDKLDSDMKLGYQAGAYVDYTLPNNLFFQSGLIFETKGAKYEQNPQYNYFDYGYNSSYADVSVWQNEKVSINSIYLQVPLYVGYKFEVADNLSVYFSGGPYFAYGIGGKATIETSLNGEKEKNKVDVFGDEAWKRFDAGFSLLLGVERKRFSFNAGYDFGMVNVDRQYDVYNRNLFVNVGYRVF